ncbi:MAG: hypothetical protein U1F34_00615, partial [Gammaproteobacteria bacterium]
VNFIEGLSLRQQSVDARDKAAFYEARYNVAHKRLPATVVPPTDIDAAVNVVDALQKYKSNPLGAMRIVSRALDSFPNLQIDKIDWITSGDPSDSPDRVAGGSGAAGEGGAPMKADAAPTSAADGKQYLYYQIAVIGGHVSPFAGDYREALSTVEKFAQALQAAGHAYKVEVVQQPLDVSSGANLQGAADTREQKQEAKFSVRMVLGVEGSHEEG